MSLTIVTKPISGSVQTFSGFESIEYVFKREDFAINTVVDDSGSAKITYTGDKTSEIVAGDTLYLYSEGLNYTYAQSVEVVSHVAGAIITDADYIENGTGGYINYYKNYYVELQLVNPDLSGVNLLDFSIIARGDAAGNITANVNIINDLNYEDGAISLGKIEGGTQEFEVQYREVYDGSSNSFTLLNGELLIVVYATETPEIDEVLDEFENPELYLGYDQPFVVAHEAGTGSNWTLYYDELDINKGVIKSDDLGGVDNTLNGLFMYKWASTDTVESNTYYIDFEPALEVLGDFASPDFASPDFKITA